MPASTAAVVGSGRSPCPNVAHGDSDKPMTGYRVEDFAADVVPFLDVLGIDRAVLAGHSGSCPMVRRVAIDQPERVAGLVLEASPTTLHGDARLEEFVETVVGPRGPDQRGLRPLLYRRDFVGGARPQGPGPARGRAAQGPGSRADGDVYRTPALRRHPRTGAHHRTGTVDLGRGRCARRTRHAGPAGRAHARHDHNRVPRRRTHPAVGRLVTLRRRCHNVRSDYGCDIGD